MPRVALTQAQREEQRLQDRAERLADGLAIYKRRHRLNNYALARAVGIGHETVSRLMAADRTVRLPLETAWRLEQIARLGNEEGAT